MAESPSRDALRQLGQLDLGDWIEVATKEKLWSIQHKIATAISQPHSRVAVPSCNASGKTWLASRIAMAFFDAYRPGTPCHACGGPCRGAKIITTSSQYDHLRNNMWSELRSANARMKGHGIILPGRLLDGDLRFEDGPDHLMVGQSPDTAEGMQGYHAAHILVIGDEATAISDETALGITRLMSSGDARMLLIFNPTTAGTYAHKMTRAEGVVTIPITAWDTPNFTNEDVPPGADLISHRFLADLKAAGMGPGTYEWETSVEAKFWDQGEDVLIPAMWVERSLSTASVLGIRQIGVDLASYGTDECVIAFREGNDLTEIRAFPSMRMDTFWETHVAQAVRDFEPHYLVYDADGIGAGVIGDAERVARTMPPGGQLMGFRGGIKISDRYYNARGAWWWNLRRRFEYGTIRIQQPADARMMQQLSIPKYTITASGQIKVETKEEMRKRGEKSPDRGDAVMYAFALSEELQEPFQAKATPVTDYFGVSDRTEEAMWRKMEDERNSNWNDVNPILGVPDDF